MSGDQRVRVEMKDSVISLILTIIMRTIEVVAVARRKDTLWDARNGERNIPIDQEIVPWERRRREGKPTFC